jgi:hypothetical protein
MNRYHGHFSGLRLEASNLTLLNEIRPRYIDYLVPGCDAVQFCRQIRSFHRNLLLHLQRRTWSEHVLLKHWHLRVSTKLHSVTNQNCYSHHFASDLVRIRSGSKSGSPRVTSGPGSFLWCPFINFD